MTQETKIEQKPEPREQNRQTQFSVEFGDDHNRTITIGTLNLHVRGRWLRSNLSHRNDIGDKISSMPDIPGLHMTVDTRTRQYTISDPLETDEALRIRVDVVMTNAKLKSRDTKLSAVPSVTQTLSPDRFVTLLYELHRHIDAGMCRVVAGRIPQLEEIAKMEGRQLYDPMSSNTYKPTYADQAYDYYRSIEAGVR